ncbi:hypothetical protein KFE25_013535 [Diacronema lutheri]|uniref:Peroxisomal membrane protein MPV17 n=2 Tax=Diacronema lutheri TaxID=2081491 RepID=A0A8J5XU50_DIALT|nr:hypothetical protein KFE25_013535 [Diacronema lutheri]
MRLALVQTLVLVALAPAAAFSGATALRAARLTARISAPRMRVGGGSPRGRGTFPRPAGGSAWPSSARRGPQDGGAAGGGGGRDGGGGTSRGAGPGDSDEPSEPGLAAVGALWAGYLALLKSKPVVTKALTSLLGFGLGDVLAQCCIEKKASLDWPRLARFSSAGLLIHGPMGHWFYGNLDSLIPGASARKVAIKVFVDQVVHAPIFGACFFSYLAALEGKGPVMVAKRVKHELMTQLAGSWKVWPLAHAVNFAFVPTNQRILYINSIQIGYNMFLSTIGSRGA